MTISTDLVAAAAAALASALPASSTLKAGTPVGATESSADLLPSNSAAAVVAQLGAAPGSTGSGDVAVVVNSDLVQALSTSPMGPLDLAAAVQPALDAASHASTGAPASAAAQREVEVALTELAARPGAHVVPLTDPEGAVVATVVISLAAVGARPPAFVPSGSAVGSPDTSSAGSPATDVRLPRQTSVAPSTRFGAGHAGGLDLLRDVAMEITVELGRTRMTVRELLSLTPGAVIELDRAAGSPADLLVNGTLIARGEVVVVDEDFGIRITEILAAGTDATSSVHAGPGAA